MPDESILNVFAEDSYKLGDCQMIPYDRRKVSVFGTNYLHWLYAKCLESRPKHPYGILPSLMCGFADLSADAVCSYLAGKQIILLCVHKSPVEFETAGFAWITQHIKSPSANAAFGAFVIFKPWWGTPESIVLGMLGIAYLFTTHNLRTILGQRRVDNSLAGRWMNRYGARDIGIIPDLLLTPEGGLADCVVSALSQADFERYCESQIRTLLNGDNQLGKGHAKSGAEHAGQSRST